MQILKEQIRSRYEIAFLFLIAYQLAKVPSNDFFCRFEEWFVAFSYTNIMIPGLLKRL